MPEGWDGTTRDPDEVHYEISQKEDEMLYQEFVQKMNFNKKKVSPVSLPSPSQMKERKKWSLVSLHCFYIIVTDAACTVIIMAFWREKSFIFFSLFFLFPKHIRIMIIEENK